jgi:hypothetical protein
MGKAPDPTGSTDWGKRKAVRLPKLHKVKVPYFSREEYANPLRACIARVVVETGLTPEDAHIAMTYFLEELVEQVAKGKVVSVPCFGVFFAIPVTPKHGYEKGMTFSCPRFRPHVPFQNYVKLVCPPIWDHKRKDHALSKRWRRRTQEHRQRSYSPTGFEAYRKCLRGMHRRDT